MSKFKRFLLDVHVNPYSPRDHPFLEQETRMNIQLGGKTAMVTESTAGIGFAIAQGLAESGATVVINGRTESG